MDRNPARLDRRTLIASLGATVTLALAAPARAAGLGDGLLALLGSAADRALDRLAQPGAFYNDPAIRIGLPMLGRATGSGGLGGAVLSALETGQKLGITDNVVRKLNDAAGIAVREAKPVFRSAIGQLSLSDVPGIAGQRDGATQYLRSSAGPELKTRLRPLVDKGLTQVGAYRQVERLVAGSKLLRTAAISRDTLGNSVTDQALNGIFSAMAGEEGRLRDDPAGALAGLLKGLLGN